MKIAVVTGASSGLGQAFARQIKAAFPEVEAIWLIARRKERLEDFAASLEGAAVKCLPLDLCQENGINLLRETLAGERAEVVLLINNAGCGYLGNFGEGDGKLQTTMTNLNVTALTEVTQMCLPYMKKGSHIINVSSIASFCPNPRLTVYSSTKAFVSSFTRGLSVELKPRGIGVTAVCPGPMRTEFLTVGNITGNSKTFETLPYCDPEKVAVGTLRAAKRGNVFYTPTFLYKIFRVVAKILPQAWMIKATKA